jgi:hypothetical protein
MQTVFYCVYELLFITWFKISFLNHLFNPFFIVNEYHQTKQEKKGAVFPLSLVCL